jgi:hypothetical protein
VKFNLQGLFFAVVVALLALVLGAPAERELLEQSQPKETLKTANSYGYGYGYGLYPYGYGYNGLYGWGKQADTDPHMQTKEIAMKFLFKIIFERRCYYH